MMAPRPSFPAVLVAGLVSVLPCAAQQARPAGVVLDAGGSVLGRAGLALPLRAVQGDLLYPGDTLTAEKSPAIVAVCAERARLTLAAGGELAMEAGGVLVRRGAVTKQGIPVCELPAVAFTLAATQVHSGAGLRRETFEQRVAALDVGARRALEKELAGADKAIAANPNDPVARLTRAAVLERHALRVDAAAELGRLQSAWPEASWIRAHRFALENEEDRRAAAFSEAQRRTYLLAIGISQYQSPLIRPLEFAHADAELFGEWAKSVGAEGLVLTNEKATTAAIRNAIETHLKARAGGGDTVILLLVAHGTVVPAGADRGAYVVTHDTNPEDLKNTALPLADLQKLLAEDLARTSRVVAFLDVTHSGTIGAITTNRPVGQAIARLGEGEGRLYVFTAAKPTEVSFEGLQFGGGHGAFTYFVLEALSGPGDVNADGTVTLDELTEYVRTRVAEATQDRQHPREQGNYEGTTGIGKKR